MRTLHIYSRQGCHLCKVMVDELLPLVRGRLDIEVRDIDSREDWRRDYDVRIPLLEFEGDYVCQYKLDRTALQRILSGLDESGPDSS